MKLLTAEKLTEVLKEGLTLEEFISLSECPNREAVGKALTFAVKAQAELTKEETLREVGEKLQGIRDECIDVATTYKLTKIIETLQKGKLPI